MSNNLKLINTNTINSKPIRNYIKVKNTGGPKGDTGATGATGPQGPQGPAGQAATINIGETTTLLPGQTATVTNTGTQQNATLNFGIPQGLRGPTGAQGPKGDTGPQGLKGDKGNDGAAASVTVGITNTGEPGSNASVTNLGTSSNAILSFTIPTGSRGPQGQTGPQGPKGEDGKDGEKGDKGDAGQAATVTVGSTTTTNPGTSATVTNSGTTSAAVLNFGIPRGATGSVKSEVVSELPETGEGDTFYLVNREATTQTATGKTINFTNSENAGDITDAQIDGETSQQTYTGKNLLDYPSIVQTTRNGITSSYDANTQTIMFNGTCDTDNTTFAFEDFMGFQANGTYTISYELVSGTITNPTVNTRLQFQDSNHGWSGIVAQLVQGNNSDTANLSSLTFTLANVRFDAGVVVNNYKIRVQLEKSNQATSWEQYVGGIPAPNPGYPQTVNTATGENLVKICGKNLFDGNTEIGLVSSTGTISSVAAWSLSGLIMVKPSTSYTVSWTRGGSSTSLLMSEWQADGTFIVRTGQQTGNTYTFTTNANTAYVRINYNNTNGDSNYQLELGNQASTYEPYQGQSYEVNLGKNLWPISSSMPAYNCSTTAGVDSLTLVATGANSNIYPDFKLEHNTQYTFSGSFQITNYVGAAPIGAIIQGYNGSSWAVIRDARTEISDTDSHSFAFVFNSGSYQSVRVGFGINMYNTSVANTVVLSRPQLEKGSQATSYAAFFTPIELCKIGTYQDYIYKSGEKWYVRKEVGKIPLNSISDWGRNADGRFYSSGFASTYGYVAGNGLSDQFTYSDTAWSSDGKFGITSGGNLWITTGDSTLTSVDLFNTWLGIHAPTAYFALATPTDTEITNSALITQLDNLASAALYSGINNIFTVTPNEVPTLELDYVTYDKYNQNKVYIYNEAAGVWQIIVQ